MHRTLGEEGNKRMGYKKAPKLSNVSQSTLEYRGVPQRNIADSHVIRPLKSKRRGQTVVLIDSPYKRKIENTTTWNLIRQVLSNRP